MYTANRPASDPATCPPGVARGADESRHDRQDRRYQRHHRVRIDAVAIRVAAVHVEQIARGQMAAAQHPVVGDQDAANGAHQARVADQPREDVRRSIGIELPRHHQDADGRRDEAAGHVADAARRQAREVVGRRHHVGRHVRRELREHDDERTEDDHRRVADARDESHRIPDRLAKDDDRGTRHRDANERKRGHRGGQAERLPERLRPLAACVASEVRDVQAERRPVADVCRHGGGEQLPERCAAGLQPDRFTQDVAQAAAAADGPA